MDPPTAEEEERDKQRRMIENQQDGTNDAPLPPPGRHIDHDYGGGVVLCEATAQLIDDDVAVDRDGGVVVAAAAVVEEEPPVDDAVDVDDGFAAVAVEAPFVPPPPQQSDTSNSAESKPTRRIPQDDKLAAVRARRRDPFDDAPPLDGSTTEKKHHHQIGKPKGNQRTLVEATKKKKKKSAKKKRQRHKPGNNADRNAPTKQKNNKSEKKQQRHQPEKNVDEATLIETIKSNTKPDKKQQYKPEPNINSWTLAETIKRNSKPDAPVRGWGRRGVGGSGIGSKSIDGEEGVWGMQRYIGKYTWKNSLGCCIFVGPFALLCFYCNKLDERKVFRTSDGKFYTKNGRQVKCADKDFTTDDGFGYITEHRAHLRALKADRKAKAYNQTSSSSSSSIGNKFPYNFCSTAKDCPCNAAHRPIGTKCTHDGCIRCKHTVPGSHFSSRGNNRTTSSSFASRGNDRSSRSTFKNSSPSKSNDDGGRRNMCSHDNCRCNESDQFTYTQCFHPGCRRCAVRNGDKDMAIRAMASEALGVKGCDGSATSPCSRYGCPTCSLVRAGGSGIGSMDYVRPNQFLRGYNEYNDGLSQGPFGLRGLASATPKVTMCESNLGGCPCNDPNRTLYSKCNHRGCVRCALAYGNKDKACRALAAAYARGGQRCPHSNCRCNTTGDALPLHCNHDGCTRCIMVDAGNNSSSPDRLFQGTNMFGNGNF